MLFRESPFEMPWRRAYEARAVIVWGFALLFMVSVLMFTNLPKEPFFLCASVALIAGGYRLRDTLNIWNLKLSLYGKRAMILAGEYLFKAIDYDRYLWVGKGFEWKTVHSQRLYDLKRVDQEIFMPPDWFAEFRGAIADQQRATDIGAPWVHGVEPVENDINIPLEHLAGGTLILGTTGSGKTRLFEVLIAQAIWRGDVVIIIDPKGDRGLSERAAAECKRTPGRENDFVSFHPAFPNDSIRFDPLRNWNRITEVASRVAALIPAEQPNDPFVAFSWRACNLISKGLVEVEERPNLLKLRHYVEGGADALLERALLNHFRMTVPSWEQLSAPYLRMARDGEFQKPSKSTKDELVGYIQFYQNEVAKTNQNEVIDGLINLFAHDRAHLGKMITSLIPVLDMLTTGEIGKLLSPDPMDIDDSRGIYDSAKIIKQGKVFYMGLDALSDPTVASSIGSIVLADMAAVAGSIYNYQDANSIRKVTLFIDEANAVFNPPAIEIANKARGAGITMCVATQTVPDFIARLGSEERARQVLGNFNNLIALRTKDRVTQDYIVESFGMSYISSAQYSVGTAGNSDASMSSFTGSEGVRLSDQLIETVPPEILGLLPNFHYFGLFSGGKLVKGRVPIIQG